MHAEQIHRLHWWGEVMRRMTLGLAVASWLLPGWLGLAALSGAGTAFVAEIVLERLSNRVGRPMVLRSFRAERVSAWIGLTVILVFWIATTALLIGQRA